MGPVGAIVGSALLTALLAAGLSMTTAALVSGSVFMLASGLVMLGTQKVDQQHTMTDAELEAQQEATHDFQPTPEATPAQDPRRDDGLDGRVAVITGGASGIGRALALAYARAGAVSVIGYHPGDPHDAGKVVAEVEALGGRACAVAVDVRDGDQVDAFAQTAVERFGRLDIAVAGAGILRRASLAELSDAAWDDMLSVDLTGVLRTLRAAAGAMTGPGAMVAVSSIAGGVYGWDDHAHYAAAKSGVLGLFAPWPSSWRREGSA